MFITLRIFPRILRVKSKRKFNPKRNYNLNISAVLKMFIFLQVLDKSLKQMKRPNTDTNI